MPICYFCGFVDRASGPSSCPSCERSYSERPEPTPAIKLPPHLYEVQYHDGSRDLIKAVVEASSTDQARHRIFCWCKQEGRILDLMGKPMIFLQGKAQRRQLKDNIVARRYRGDSVTNYITESPTQKGRMVQVSLVSG